MTLGLITAATADPAQAAFLMRTPPINLFGLLAHEPTLGARVAALGAAVMSGGLEPHVRELIALRVGHRLGAPYVVGQHRRVADRIGMAPDLVAAAQGDPAEGLHGDVLSLADAVVAATPLAPELAERLEARHGPAGMLEMAVVAGYFVMLSGLTRAFDLALEPPTSGGG